MANEDLDVATIDKASEALRKLRAYCRLEVEGLQNVPEGPDILVANHTGWSGLDYANLFITVYDATGRIPRVAVHPSFFQVRWMRELGEKLGFFEVSVQTSTRLLDEKGIVTFFPEAEAGNFKPFWKRYQLQEFKPGFARVALATEAPIVPVVVVGGEDANPTLGRLRIQHEALGEIPIPLPRPRTESMAGDSREVEDRVLAAGRSGDLPRGRIARQGPCGDDGARPARAHAARARRPAREARTPVLLITR